MGSEMCIRDSTFTASKELFTGNTLTSVISVILLINRLSSNPDAPENRNSNKVFDESEPIPSYAKGGI